MEAVLAVAMSDDRIAAVTCPALTKVVVRGLPFQFTTNPLTKPAPFTFSVTPAPTGNRDCRYDWKVGDGTGFLAANAVLQAIEAMVAKRKRMLEIRGMLLERLWRIPDLSIVSPSLCEGGYDDSRTKRTAFASFCLPANPSQPEKSLLRWLLILDVIRRLHSLTFCSEMSRGKHTLQPGRVRKHPLETRGMTKPSLPLFAPSFYR